jgi:DNA-binding PadR family transcriptional regulator
MPRVNLRRSPVPMSTKHLASDLQTCVLAALSSAPLDQARLFESVLKLALHKRTRGSAEREDCAPQFFDALALLQADGLVSERPHPLREFRRYYLTENGDEVAKRLGLSTGKRERLHDSAGRKLTPA